MDIKGSTIRRLFASVVLFFFGFGIGNMEKLFVLFFLVAVCWNHMKSGNYVVMKRGQLIPLFIWGLLFAFMSIMNEENALTSLVYYLVTPCVLYIYGYDLLREKNAESDFIWFSLSVAFGFFLHAFFSVSGSANSGLFRNNAEYIRDMWNGRMISRTIMGMYMVPAVCLSIPMMLEVDGKHKILKRGVAGIVIIIALAISVFVGNRALLLISVLLLAATLIMGIKLSTKKGRLIIVALVLVIGACSAYFTDTFGIRSMVSDSFIAKRNANILSDSRFLVYKQVARHFENYLLGWYTSGGIIEGTGLKWAHNVWLDIYVYGGLAPFAMFAVYTLRVIRDTRLVVKYSALKPTTKLSIIALLIGVFLSWAIEPVLQSNPYFLATCSMIFGMIARLKRVGSVEVSSVS